MGARLLPQSYQYPNLSEGADRVGGQLRGDKEGPFSGVTESGRVWRKVPESDARSVLSSVCSLSCLRCVALPLLREYALLFRSPSCLTCVASFTCVACLSVLREYATLSPPDEDEKKGTCHTHSENRK